MSDRALAAVDVGSSDVGLPSPVDGHTLRAFFESSLDLFCIAGFDGYFKHLNPAWERVLGHSLDDLYASPFIDFVHPDDRRASMAEAQRVASGSETVRFVDRYRTTDGDYRWLSWTACPITDEALVIAVARDITDKRAGEAELRASEQRFRTLIQSAPGGILIVDGAGCVTLANREVEEMFGYQQAELIGKPVELLVPDARRAAHADLREEFSEQPRHRPMGAVHGLFGRRRDGTEFPVGVGLAPLPSESGHLVAATVTDMTKQFMFEEELRITNDELQARLDDLEELGRESDLTSEMAEMLQASQTDAEAHRVVELFARRLFIYGSGAVGLINESRNHVEHVADWGTAQAGLDVFDPDDCWAMRRGKSHFAASDEGLVCPHLFEANSARSLCVPLLAQGTAIGVLTKVCKPGGFEKWDRIQRLAVTFGDHLSLALANLQLRRTLQTQSIRDPLTGLFNRRYMEESMEREFARARRHKSPLGVIMLDVDHFKQFNDNHGHRAGDAALVAVGNLVPQLVRAEDIPCRFGGEEFALILPDAAIDQVALRAEQIRRALADLPLEYSGEALGYVTLSAGVAGFPDHGESVEEVIHAADQALYAAKDAGRNRVVVADL